jgi:hypothetical protein
MVATEDVILTPLVWRRMKDVVSHYGTGGTSQRIVVVPAPAGTRDSLVILLGREILATRSRHGMTGANCDPECSDSVPCSMMSMLLSMPSQKLLCGTLRIWDQQCWVEGHA